MTNESDLIKENLQAKSSNNVVIVDVNIPFWSMVRLIITFSIAAIPAFLFLVAFYMATIYLFSLFR